MFILKLSFTGDTRRATLTEESKPDYANLERHVRELYGESIPQDRNLKLKYLDDEGDAISVSCDHDLREAFLFRALTGRSTLRVDVIMTERVCIPGTGDCKDSESGAASLGQDWRGKVRGRFNGIVDACQKLGVMLQKKLEEKRSAQATKLLDPAQQSEEEGIEEAQKMCLDGEKDRESASPAQVTGAQHVKEETDKEKEKETEPEIREAQNPDDEARVAPVVVIPAPPHSEWREMLKMYELSVAELVEMNARLQPHKNHYL